MKVGFLSSYPPRRCGIAEFNQDLLTALSSIPNFTFCGIAINQSDVPEKFEAKYKVMAQIRKNIKADYFEAANKINKSDIDLLCIQLEYSLYGGFDGAYLKLLINSLQKKTIIIVHGSPINQYSRRPIVRERFFKEIESQVFQFITINPLQKKRFQQWDIKQVTNIFHGAPDKIKSFSYSKSRQKL